MNSSRLALFATVVALHCGFLALLAYIGQAPKPPKPTALRVITLPEAPDLKTTLGTTLGAQESPISFEPAPASALPPLEIELDPPPLSVAQSIAEIIHSQDMLPLAAQSPIETPDEPVVEIQEPVAEVVQDISPPPPPAQKPKPPPPKEKPIVNKKAKKPAPPPPSAPTTKPAKAKKPASAKKPAPAKKALAQQTSPKKPASTKKPAAAAISEDQKKLLALMQASLAEIDSKGGKGSSKGTAKANASTGGSGSGSAKGRSGPAIGKLQSESVVITGGSASFASELALYLKHALLLPEPGEVQVKLKLHTDGKLAEFTILSSSVEKNSAYVKKRFKELHFPAPSDSTNSTFHLTLKGD